MKRLNLLDWIALVLVILGGIYWGFIGLLNFDILIALFGKMSMISRIVYILVGVAAIYLIFTVGSFGRKR